VRAHLDPDDPQAASRRRALLLNICGQHRRQSRVIPLLPHRRQTLRVDGGSRDMQSESFPYFLQYTAIQCLCQIKANPAGSAKQVHL
jgi:hypothetical protein